MYSVEIVFMFALRQKIRTKKWFIESGPVRGIDEVKAKNLLPFGQHSQKRTHTRYFLLTKRSELRNMALYN